MLWYSLVKQNLVKKPFYLKGDESHCRPENPCQGGGTCEEHDGTFTCFCTKDRTGDTCQTKLSDSVSVAAFSGHSYVKLHPIKNADHKIRSGALRILFFSSLLKESSFVCLRIDSSWENKKKALLWSFQQLPLRLVLGPFKGFSWGLMTPSLWHKPW